MGEVYDNYIDSAGNWHWTDTESGERTIPASEYSKWDKFIKDDFVTHDSTLKGWVCPVCGRGLSPYTAICPCKGFNPGWKVTC